MTRRSARSSSIRSVPVGGGHRSAAMLAVAVVAFSLLVSACATGSTTSPVASTALRPVNQAGLQALVNENAAALHMPGAVLLLHTPDGSFTVTYGTTKLAASSPPSSTTRFRIASVTKTMTAAVVLQLVQEGKLSLGDPVSKYVSGVPNGQSITIAELLAMRSGLYNHTNDPQIASSIDRDPTRVWTPEQLLAIAFAHPPNFPPGTRFEYNNTNYVLLGLVIEAVDHRSLAQAMQTRLFGPLGMKDTFFPAITSSTLPNPFSHGYLYGSSSVALTGEPPYTDQEKTAIMNGSARPNDYTDVNHSFAPGAGNVVSDANDLATWIKAYVGGRVLSPELQRIWFDSIRPEDPNNPTGMAYGYGINRLQWGPNTVFLHGGETPGYNSEALYDPTNKVTLVVWTNLTVSSEGQPTANTLMLKTLDRAYKVSPFPPQASAVTAPPPSPSAEP